MAHPGSESQATLCNMQDTLAMQERKRSREALHNAHLDVRDSKVTETSDAQIAQRTFEDLVRMLCAQLLEARSGLQSVQGQHKL
jgi:GTP cyclohydrolase III